MEEHALYIGIAAGICTGISALPQLIKLIRIRKSEDISFWMLSILVTGLAGWVLYGVLRNDYPLIVTNGFGFIVNALIIVFAVRYRN
ncbi:SemiSWEET transporter [Pedobacter sp. SYP-B3415]|uniref:SemiSWEET transporter n=1 Tax=Pedobacter sp. SYP-B3415 TaxID=2496641 RepID=UPI00101D972E|nr:SemiSWEET transporter [Pedobacter sp. SYP-B3415]